MRNPHLRPLIISAIISVSIVFASLLMKLPSVFASTEEPEDDIVEISDYHHVTIFDGDEKLSVKSDAGTVAEILSRAKITLESSDKVEPALDTAINVDNFFINIYRSHSALVLDGDKKYYVSTPSYEPTTVARNAGLEIYDGDEVKKVVGFDFLEFGVNAIYSVERGDGARITVTEDIPYEESTYKDFDLDYGKSEVTQLGELGQKKTTYSVKYIDGEESSRELISEEVLHEPVTRITRVGARITSSTSAGENESITWQFLKENGFSDAQTAGIMGNLMQEHHFDTSDSYGGLGIAQWTGGRRNNLLARDNPYSIHTQLTYLMDELRGAYPHVLSAIQSSSSIEDATIIFQNQFERCGICREDQRINYAYDIYNRYAK